ncbi:hypothetical protein K438DRAFT_1964935 [Mycena galopus ATCC 62051]|nr:hypothetical protein K438DRAFT_1964935 [Mycena galopus ATCC 62051]
MGFFTGMMSQFMRDAMANGSLPAFPISTLSNTPVATNPQPLLPTISVPPVIPYSSLRQSIALPAAPTGHPLPSGNLSTFRATQPMLGMSGLGIPLVPGHSNNARLRRTRRRVRDLSPTQISETNIARRTAAADHLGPAGAALQLRNRRVRGNAIRGPTLESSGTGTLLEQVSFVDALGVHQIKLTTMPGQEVPFYKNYGSSFGRYLEESQLSFPYTVPETTKVTTILEMTAAAMRTSPCRYSFGPIPSGPSTTQQHERLDLQVLAFVNTGKNRGAGSAHLRRATEVNVTLALKDVFSRPWKNLFTVPTLCIQDGRLVLHAIVRYDGINFVEMTANRSLPLRHHCLGTRQNRQFTESVEMNVNDSDSAASETSGGVPSDLEDDDEDMPTAPIMPALTQPSRGTQAAHRSDLQASSSAPVAGQVPQRMAAGSPLVPGRPTTHIVTPEVPANPVPQATTTITPPWGTSTFIAPAPGPYRDLFDCADVPAAIYQAVGGTGRLELQANSLHDLAMLYIDRVRTASAINDFTSLLCPRRKFKNPSIGIGLERETIHTALNMFLADAGQWFVPTDEGRLTLVISMPAHLASTIPPSRLERLRVVGALVSLSLISGKPPGSITPALLQYALNGRRLESLTPDFVATWHPTVARLARAMQAVGPHGSLLPFRTEIINYLNIQISALSQRDENQHNTLVTQVVHNAVLGPDINGLEANAFCGGVELTHGPDSLQLAHSYPGGIDFYLSHAWTGQIVDFLSVDRLMVISEPSQEQLVREFGVIATALDAQGLFLDFLKGTGTPCPLLLEEGKSHFDAAVIDELLNIDLVSFRPRMFCWATTGSPFLDPDPEFDSHDPMSVHFVLPGDAF